MKRASGTRFPVDYRAPPLTALNRLKSAVNRIHERWPDAGTTVERNPEAIIDRMDRRLRTATWDGATIAEVLRAARVAFSVDFRSRFKLGRLRRFFVDEVRVSRSAGYLGGMMSVYLSTYVPGANHTRSLAHALNEAREHLGARWSGLLESYPEVLDPKAAHESIAWRMRTMRDPWRELQANGVRSPHGPGLMEHVHLAYLDDIADRLKTRDGIDTLCRWLKPGKQAKVGGAAEAIEALLEPWLSRPPPEDLRTHLLDQVVRLYGDPRVPRGLPWSRVGDAYTHLVLQWLTGESIRFFLDVVSRANISHMWEERREFWLGLYEQGRIDAAWVAFSVKAAELAGRIKPDGHGQLAFGKQTGPRPDTSLLVLAIGRCVVVEGSHSYKVHFFKSSNRNTPRLFQPTYDCESIRHRSDDAQTHHVRWQNWVLEKLDYYS